MGRPPTRFAATDLLVVYKKYQPLHVTGLFRKGNYAGWLRKNVWFFELITGRQSLLTIFTSVGTKEELSQEPSMAIFNQRAGTSYAQKLSRCCKYRSLSPYSIPDYAPYPHFSNVCIRSNSVIAISSGSPATGCGHWGSRSCNCWLLACPIV